MSRPPRVRRVRSCTPKYSSFKPAGIPARELESVVLLLDELEAICLTDNEGLYQEEAAEKMGVSRQTFGNILTSAHKKVSEMLIQGKLLTIEGGNVCCCLNGTDHHNCCRRYKPKTDPPEPDEKDTHGSA
jgi:uncharacterized protein